MLHHVSNHLSSHQKLYVAGGSSGNMATTSWFVEGNSNPQPDPVYSSNAEEADTMIMASCIKNTTTPLKI